MSEDARTHGPRHRVAVFVAAAHSHLRGLADVPVWSMNAQETASTLVGLTRLRAQVAELELRVAAHARATGVGCDEGATSTANWWSHHTNLTRAEAHRLTRLAGLL
ncbi:MAG: HNH endonuclease, partial [Nocardioides sp.]